MSAASPESPASPECGPPWHAAECLLPGVTPALAAAFAGQIRAELAASAAGVAFLGSLLMPEDEVLLCLFAGTQAQVRAVSEGAGLPFERIVACVGLDWRP